MTKYTTKLPGRIYKKRNKRPDGTTVDHATWTVRFKNKDHSTGETDPKKAEQFLLRLIAGGAPPAKPWAQALAAAAPPESEPKGTLMSEVLNLFVADSRRRRLASAPGNEGIVRNYLMPFFGKVPANELTTRLLNTYTDQRMKLVRDKGDEAKILSKGASVNRELAALKRALNHSMREQDPPLLQRYPHIAMLPQSKPRKGFLAHRDYMTLRHALPDYWVPVYVTAYHVGRRRGELLQLEIADVDLDNRIVRVPAGITKNGKPSEFPIYTADMLRTLTELIDKTRREHPECKLLFHKNGQSIHKNETFYQGWKDACKAVGLKELLFHDLRRTACKMLIDAGNSRQEAMLITGHLTESAFNRYHIMDQRTMRTAAERAATYLAAQQEAALRPVSRLVS